MGLSFEPTVEQKKIYKNARIAFAENTEKISRIQQNSPDNNTKSRDEFDFKKHVNTSSMNLTCDEMSKVRSLCTKFETTFSRNSNDMGFCDRTHHKINWEKKCGAIQTYIWQHELLETKSHEKNC